MPQLPGSNCKKPGCPGIVRDRVCSVCGSTRTEDRRQSSSMRGYDHTWRKLRGMVLRSRPLCAECERIGRTTAATDVHHIVALRDGGRNTADNLQPLCHSCHSRITARDTAIERRDDTPITIIAGPPGSGKTTYALQHMRHGDLLVDLDALYGAISGALLRGDSLYDKPVSLLPFACEARDAIMQRLQRQSNIRHAWIVTGESNRAALEDMGARLQAEIVVLDASPNECMKRINADERRRENAAEWLPLVDKWWRDRKSVV